MTPLHTPAPFLRRGWLAALAFSALLAACGGGGDDGTPVAGGEPITVPSGGPSLVGREGPIVVNTVPAPPPTAADCSRISSDARAQAELDLSDPNVRAVHDEVLAVDPAHAWRVFIRMPGQFVNWIATTYGTLSIDTIGLATHETMHNLSAALLVCDPAPGAQYLLLGETVASGLQFGETANYSIVAETLPAELKTHFRYDTYIPAAANASGNDFRILLDELAAYVGGAHTERLYIASGRAGDDRRALEYNLGGMVNFMVYLQAYLQAARLDYPATHAAIRGNATTVAAVQRLWTQAEVVLRESYPLTRPGSVPRLDYSRAYFDAAYSPALLAELDAIGVTRHGTADTWASTYLR